MIPPTEWPIDTFAEMTTDEDVIREPRDDYPGLSETEKDKLRQTQVFQGEIVQRLGTYAGFNLIKKYDGTKGWVKNLKPAPEKGFHVPGSSENAESFLAKWKGTPYVFGGCSLSGVDCSGFTQSFYLNVFGILLPKNSRDQRKLAVSAETDRDFDLLFCHHIDQAEHDVALLYKDQFWHARRKGGVVCQSKEDLTREFVMEEHKRILS